jgi:hypothetical protein
MRRLICIGVLFLITPLTAMAQGFKDCIHINDAPVATDPVSSRLMQVFDCYSNGLIIAAEWVPSDKYTQRMLETTVGDSIGHVAYLNDFACSKISGVATPQPKKLDGAADKDGIVAWLKSSVQFCRQVFSKLSDSQLVESIPWEGFDPAHNLPPNGARVTRFAAALWVTNVLTERYGALAGYLQIGPSLSNVATVPLVEKGH